MFYDKSVNKTKSQPSANSLWPCAQGDRTDFHHTFPHTTSHPSLKTTPTEPNQGDKTAGTCKIFLGKKKDLITSSY